jgi:hypothetical protein
MTSWTLGICWEETTWSCQATGVSCTIADEHLQQSPNITLLIKWYCGSPISLSRFIGGVAATVPPIYLPQYPYERWVPQKCKRKYG